MRRHPELQAALSCPMPSLRSPFNRDGSINQPALRNCVERSIANGAKSLMLTFGDTHYSVLTDAEVEVVTRIGSPARAGAGGRATHKAIKAMDRNDLTGPKKVYG